MAARPRTPSRSSTLVGSAAVTAAFLVFKGFLHLSLFCSSVSSGWSSGVDCTCRATTVATAASSASVLVPSESGPCERSIDEGEAVDSVGRNAKCSEFLGQLYDLLSASYHMS
ncbi:hypothetical protein PF011_g32676 [Phytophthora fragariae]|uniref:Uncharacterized protein n=1 Tax=Phytophthora fragariae TaxID=53985 RepID=A0A6A3GF36_9STRA|nr:hypothetical protein PF011_g32676 [Phytophthora fragariae]